MSAESFSSIAIKKTQNSLRNVLQNTQNGTVYVCNIKGIFCVLFSKKVTSSNAMGRFSKNQKICGKRPKK